MYPYPHLLAPVVFTVICVASTTGGVANAQPFEVEVDLSGLPINYEPLSVFIEPDALVIGVGWDLTVEFNTPESMDFDTRFDPVAFIDPDVIFSPALLAIHEFDRGGDPAVGVDSTDGVRDLFRPGADPLVDDLRFRVAPDGVLTLRSEAIGGGELPGGVFAEGSAFTIRYIPAPATAAIGVAGMLGLARRRRA